MDVEQAKKLQGILGALLRQHRNSAGLTQDDVAVRIDVDRRHYGRIESGQSKVSIVRLIEICWALDIDPGLLVNYLAKECRHEG